MMTTNQQVSFMKIQPKENTQSLASLLHAKYSTARIYFRVFTFTQTREAVGLVLHSGKLS